MCNIFNLRNREATPFLYTAIKSYKKKCFFVWRTPQSASCKSVLRKVEIKGKQKKERGRRERGEEGKRTDVNLKRESRELVIRLALLLYF